MAKTKRWYLRPWVLVCAALLAFVLVRVAWVGVIIYLVQPVRVAGGAMAPTYTDGDLLLLEKAFSAVERGEVVAFNYPRDRSKSFLMRVVGLPGEHVLIEGGAVVVGGQRLDEPYVEAALNQMPTPRQEFIVPDGELFVLGDNRDMANDSRAWGTVPLDAVYGKVLFRYWCELCFS